MAANRRLALGDSPAYRAGRGLECLRLEFVDKIEVADAFADQGFEEVSHGEGQSCVTLPDQEGVVRFHLCVDESRAEPAEGAKVIHTTIEKLPKLIEQVVHRLNLVDMVLVPVGKWRNIFDAVAFSLADNEHWQEVDAAATVKLNTRDPLLCGPADLHLVIDLITALFKDAEGPQQGLVLVATAVPVVAEIVPDGAVRLSTGNQVLADVIMGVVPA